jgi:hypothetical protein
MGDTQPTRATLASWRERVKEVLNDLVTGR